MFFLLRFMYPPLGRDAYSSREPNLRVINTAVFKTSDHNHSLPERQLSSVSVAHVSCPLNIRTNIVFSAASQVHST